MSYDYGYDYGVSSTAATGAAAGLLGGSIVTLVISLLVCVLMIVSIWKIYTKCGKPGWASIVPIYNIIVLLEIVELPVWYIILCFIPFANIYVAIKIYLGLAKRFGKTAGFAIGMIFLPLIFFPILAFAKDSASVEEAAPVQEPVQAVQPEPVAPVQEPAQPEPVAPVQAVQPEPVAPVQEPAQAEILGTPEPVQPEPIVQEPVQPEVPVQEPATEPFPSLGNVVEKPASESTITEGMPEVNEVPVQPAEPVQPVSDATLAENAGEQNIQNTDFMNNNNGQ